MIELHDDLLRCLSDDGSEAIIHHRLLIETRVEPARYGYINELYEQKLQSVREAWARRDWEKYTFLHERPYRLHALRRCMRRGLDDAEYWRLVGETWADCQNVYQNQRLWRATWNVATPGREHVMTNEEQEAFSSLPEETIVWRGVGHPAALRGLAWTGDKDKALWFARRNSDDGSSLIAEAQVKRADVLAIILRRQEHEVVCRAVSVTSVQTLS